MQQSPEQTLRVFQAHNEKADRILLYYLADRGFYAEINFIARVAMYAFNHDLKLVIDSSDFSYRARQGWQDYFLPFCPIYDETQHEVFQIARFGDARTPRNARGPGYELARELTKYFPEQVEIGGEVLKGLDITGAFLRAIYRLNPECQSAVDQLIQAADVSRPYDCIHIRRGDKVGDQDIFYPSERYFAQLRHLNLGDDVFLMSDDYSAVQESMSWLGSNGFTNRVKTLCKPNYRGFDQKLLWDKTDFFSHDENEHHVIDSFPDYLYRETVQLIAEIELARRSRNFVGTVRSNVFRVVKYLNPDICLGVG